MTNTMQVASSHTSTNSDNINQNSITVPRVVYFTKTAHHEPYSRISPLRPEMSAAGKNVLVTGGGTGIGKAIAIAFAQAGAKSVAILGRREDRLKAAIVEMQNAASSPKTVFLHQICDLTQRMQVERAFDAVVKTIGQVDILISNAGFAADLGPAASFDVNAFMNSFELNVLTALNAVQVFLTHCGSKPAIICISSCIAHVKPMPNVSACAVSKAANLKMMDYLAVENPDVFIVNLQPGTAETEMTKKVGVRGSTQVDLPGHFCVWLCSREAEFLRGKFVWANWDVDELVSRQEEIKNSRLFTWGFEGVPL